MSLNKGLAILLLTSLACLGAGCGQNAATPTRPRISDPLSGGTDSPIIETKTPEPEEAVDLNALKAMDIDLRDLYPDVLCYLGPRNLNEDGSIKADVITQLKKVKKLTEMSMLGTPISDAALAQLKDLPRVTKVVLSKNTLITNAGIAKLATMPNLSELYLFQVPLTDDAFVGIARLPKLKLLYVEKIPLGDKALEHLKSLKELESLGVDPAGEIGATGLAYLKSLPKLKKLDLFAVAADSKLDDASLKEIGGISSLESLVFGPILPAFPSEKSTAFTDAGLTHLARLKNLKQLNISYSSHITDAGLANIKGLTNLENLVVGFCPKLTDAGLVHLQGLTKLDKLTLNGLAITDKGLANLKALPNLRWLDLRDTGNGVTDKGILLFKDSKTLEDLILFQTGTTEKGAAELKNALPELSISQ